MVSRKLYHKMALKESLEDYLCRNCFGPGNPDSCSGTLHFVEVAELAVFARFSNLKPSRDSDCESDHLAEIPGLTRNSRGKDHLDRSRLPESDPHLF